MNLLDLLSDNPDRDLLTAYRKVKCDLFYGTLPERTKLAEFEKDLKGNLDAIKNALRDGNTNYFLSLAKQGGYWLCPKSFKPDKNKQHAIFAESRKSSNGSVEKKGSAEYRLMANLPISFHIVTTLWILSVGEALETAVSGDSYGNRIRRTQDGYVSTNALGTFKPYIHQYEKWRENAFKTVRKSLDEGKRLIVLTGDFSSFYHTLTPGFLNDDLSREALLNDVPRKDSVFEHWVVDKIDVSENDSRRRGIFAKTSDEKRTLSETAKRFTDIVVQMLKDWAKGTPLNSGLPVGCSISSVIANLALASFDRTIRREVLPLYYGRYVDDFILVLENTRNASTLVEVWKWLSGRFSCDELSIETNESRARAEKSSEQTLVSIAYRSITAYRLDELHLNVKKSRVFILEGDNGRDLVETIRQTIQQTKSEWRLLPEWIEDNNIATGIRRVVDDKGEDADSFHVAKGLSFRRANLSLNIRTFESYGRLLQDEDWKTKRKLMLGSILYKMDDASFYFDYSPYVFRFFGLFLRHLDEQDETEGDDVVRLCDRICNMANLDQFKSAFIADQDKWKRDRDELLGNGEPTSEPRIVLEQQPIPDTGEAVDPCRRYIFDQIHQTIAISMPSRLSESFREKLFRTLDKLGHVDLVRSAAEIDRTAISLFVCDLAASPLRMFALEFFSRCVEKVSAKDGATLSSDCRTNLSENKCRDAMKVYTDYQTHWKKLSNEKSDPIGDTVAAVLRTQTTTRASANENNQETKLLSRMKRVSGWYFPTRPFSFSELFAFVNTDIKEVGGVRGKPRTGNSEKRLAKTLNKKQLINYLLTTRGYSEKYLDAGFPDCPATSKHEKGPFNRVVVHLKKEKGKVRVAVTNWKSDESSWVASVVGQRDPCSATRFSRFTRLVNRILSERSSVDYVVFPELSIPVKWFFDAANKLNRAKISLVAGVEYLHGKDNIVSNEVWCSLHMDKMRFPASAIIRFQKSKPAMEEASELWKLARRRFSPENSVLVRQKICQHGLFCFGVLICSELLDVENRAWMTGRIDALFVPEWNKDTETFDSLVEATAMDLHTYVVQCNDRAYGDSRIRCPAKKAHKRDLLRVRGGELDDFNVGTIPFDRLRRFQSAAIPPTGPGEDYKPTPPGFVIADYRRALPCRSPETES